MVAYPHGCNVDSPYLACGFYRVIGGSTVYIRPFLTQGDEFMDIRIFLEEKRKIVDEALDRFLPDQKQLAPRLHKAIRYTMAGGKRIRPVLILATAQLLGKAHGRVIYSACGIECMHTSTLILDDMPCMDDSDLRRGKVSCHVKFGESTAILASYGLVMLGFELIAKNLLHNKADRKTSARIIDSVSSALGYRGVTSGQFLDLETAGKKVAARMIKNIHETKTTSLFMCCCEVASLLCGASNRQAKALKEYAKNMGFAFQISDDILSVTVSESRLGKHTKQDKFSPNFVNLFGMEKAQSLLSGYIYKANKNLAPFGQRARILQELVDFVKKRKR